MIHYSLQCTQSHAFDGWFPSSAGFDDQVARHLVACPVCGDLAITRALMAPALSRKANTSVARIPPVPEPVTPPAAPPQVAVSGAAMPAQLRAALQRLRAEVEQKCEYVGPAFADEARRIHEGESKVRGIYGEATPEEAEALAEDGIGVARLPWVPRADG